jgi:hypothetical protein
MSDLDGTTRHVRDRRFTTYVPDGFVAGVVTDGRTKRVDVVTVIEDAWPRDPSRDQGLHPVLREPVRVEECRLKLRPDRAYSLARLLSKALNAIIEDSPDVAQFYGIDRAAMVALGLQVFDARKGRESP